jgi:hypothetical protein
MVLCLSLVCDRSEKFSSSGLHGTTQGATQFVQSVVIVYLELLAPHPHGRLYQGFRHVFTLFFAYQIPHEGRHSIRFAAFPSEQRSKYMKKVLVDENPLSRNLQHGT